MTIFWRSHYRWIVNFTTETKEQKILTGCLRYKSAHILLTRSKPRRGSEEKEGGKFFFA